MREQTKHFDERVFESVISGGGDFYKVASPLVKITEASEKTSEETKESASEKSSGRLVENDTINLLSDNERTVFEEILAHLKVTGNDLSEILKEKVYETTTRPR